MKKPQIWAIGGGKGGVGKSMLSGNIGIALAQKGAQVVLIDGDLGGANLHTCLGVSSPKVGLSDYILRHVPQLKDTVVSTPVPNLGLISGAKDHLTISNPKHAQKLRVLRAIQNLEADYVILDLGASNNFNTLDFFLLADSLVIVVVPEPTSIENAYRFIKSAFYRQVRQNSPTSSIRTVVDQTMERNNRFGIQTPHELLTHIRNMGEEFSEFVDQQVTAFHPKLILNQIRSNKDIRVGFAMGNACAKYFGIQLDFVGYLEYDDAVWQSIVRRQPLLAHFSQTPITSKIRDVCDNLLYGRLLESEKVL